MASEQTNNAAAVVGQKSVAWASASNNDQNNVRTNEKVLQETNLQLQLCYLQICQALPVVVIYIIFAAYMFHDFSTVPGFTVISSGMSFEAARRALDDQSANEILRQFTILSAFCHCYDAYLYLLFSRAFREAFRERVCRKQAQNNFSSNAHGTH